jgi:predicted restriction endonuclease
MSIDERFVLIADNEDKLYPYKKSQLKTGRYGFALSAEGEQDRNGQGTYTESIEEMIRLVVFEGYGVRAKAIDKKRDGTFKLNKNVIKGYELSEEFENLVKHAKQKPITWLKSEAVKASKIETKTNSTEKIVSENKFVDEITLREIKTRRGQPEFRKSLLDIFDGKCCVTGCNVESVLEAAHIIPHSEESNYSILNGLLLRADIHTLYDLNLIGIDGNGKVFVSETLRESEYWQFQGKIIAENIPPEMSANLAKRFESFSQTGDFN